MNHRLLPLAMFVASAFGYAASAFVSIHIAGVHGQFAALWVANVGAYAVLARNPDWRNLSTFSGLFAGCVAANLLKGSAVGPSLLFAAVAVTYVNMLLLTTAKLLERPDDKTTSVQTLAATFLTIAVVSTITSFAFGAVARLAFGWPVVDAATQWLMSNVTGAAVILPTAMLLTRKRLRAILTWHAGLRLLAWSIGCAAIMITALMTGHFPFAYVMVPLLVAATRLPSLDIAIVCLVTGACALVQGTSGHVLNLQRDVLTITVGYQFAVAVNIVMPVLGNLLLEKIREGNKRVATSEERFRRAMDQTGVGMLNIDLTGRIIETNPAFAAMLGYTPADLNGRNVQELTPVEDLYVGNDARAAVIRGDIDHCKFQKRYFHRDGSRVWVEVTASVMYSQETGKPVYMISQVQDISARKRAEAKLADMEARWDFALASTGQGFWDLDSKKGGLVYSTTWTAVLGYDEGELSGDADVWLTLVHPDDYERVSQADKDHQSGKTPHFEMEYRIRHKTGRWLWVLDRGMIIERNEDGTIVRAIGTLTDITRRKFVEDDLSRTAALLSGEKERLRVTLNSIGDAVICTDSNGRISFMNPVAEKMTRVPASDGIGQRLRDVYLAVDEETGRPVEQKFPEDQPKKSSWHSLMIIRRDGSRRSIREVISPIVAETNEVDGHVIVFQDVTEMRAMQRELAHAAAHDVLTGLVNRSVFMTELEDLMTGSRGEGDHQLLYVDLDKFKAVNDSGGHAAGDALLREIAGSIQSAVRANDVVARLGGDEFGIVLRSCPPSYARLVAQNIVDTIAAIDFQWSGVTYRVGASIGLATVNTKSGSIDAVMERADRACYAAKAAGRGCVWEAELDDGKVIELPRKPRSVAS